MVQGNSTHPVYEFGPFRLEESEFRLLRDGRPVPLKGKTFQLLLLLVQNAGHVLTKPELMTHLWPDNFVEDHNLAVQISDLRNALGREHQYIVTVSRYGYRFTPTVTKHEQASERSGGETAVGCFHDGRPRELFTLAVLPFKIIGGSTEDAYLELGVADALITRLSTLKHVIVRPTSAIRRYAGYADAITAGQALKVQLVIEGSIQRIRESVRITVQLINVSDGSALWAGKYDGSCSDILGLEDYVTEQVAAALALELTLGETRRLMNRQTESVEAHIAYMKGYFYWGKRTRGHSAEVKKEVWSTFRAPSRSIPNMRRLTLAWDVQSSRCTRSIRWRLKRSTRRLKRFWTKRSSWTINWPKRTRLKPCCGSLSIWIGPARRRNTRQPSTPGNTAYSRTMRTRPFWLT
jgi:DNA-binding winged helix-turn-helix (wHTH) protein